VHFDLITIFPDFFRGPLDYGIVRRAREARLLEIAIQDLREFTHDRHRTVDDRPFSGGEGMVMKPEPIFEAVESLIGPVGDASKPRLPCDGAEKTAVVLLSASGKLFNQQMARRFVQCERIILICGRYEGVDERVAEHLATDEISIGDFVLSGGELAAAMVLDAVTRLIPGALGNEDSVLNESFSVLQERTDGSVSGEDALATVFGARGILECAQYTRPQNFRGWEAPQILVSGNHEEVRRWREHAALEKTKRNRPDLLVSEQRRGQTKISGDD